MNDWFEIGRREAILLNQPRPPNSIAKMIPYLIGFKFSKKPRWVTGPILRQRWHDLHILKHKDRLFRNNIDDTRRF